MWNWIAGVVKLCIVRECLALHSYTLIYRTVENVRPHRGRQRLTRCVVTNKKTTARSNPGWPGLEHLMEALLPVTFPTFFI